MWSGPLEKLDDNRWRIPKSYMPGMRVDGIIYADDKLIESIKNDKAPEQVANAACLPGIVKYSLAMPDIHWGYGLPIGGVVATDIDNGGVITPGGVGYDINCGVRLIRTKLDVEEVRPKIKELLAALYNNIPAGVGSEGNIRVSQAEEKKILIQGAKWAVNNGYGIKEDLDRTEDNGAMEGADPACVSERAFERGKRQAGTLGSGNHFFEIQYVDQIFDEEKAAALGLRKGIITLMVHSGSRGFGYQICDDYARGFVKGLSKYCIDVPDRQLSCAPVLSDDGQRYIKAMKCAANYAWNNRQCMMHLARETFERFFRKSFQELGIFLVYDIAHNIAKFEDYDIDGKKKKLCVHRKGATRAFPGQPIIIPGDMGRCSYLLTGTEKAKETFYSTCHGAGRVLSRSAAINACRGRSISKELAEKGIVVMAAGRGTLAEEMPDAYKDVNDVVNVVHDAGISLRVARMRPLGVIKG